jgi:SNF2 family DNA or RNA helicase
LAVAARDELKRVYLDLLAWIEQVAAKDPSNSDYAEAKTALVAARGAWLGGTQLARMAASDPAALLSSRSAGAALLSAQGLIEAANRVPGTKRSYVTKLCVDRVMVGERILVFTEFASVARGLISDLRDAGLRVGEILGGGGKARDEHVEAFARGERDVMVSTSAGERGLNLQSATTLVMYDLPWTPSPLLQRIGRAHRIGATAKELQLIFPIMKGTVEERVVSIVAARAAEVMQALDTGRGTKASESEFGRAFSGLVGVADLTQLNKREAALLEVTRVLLLKGGDK